MTRSIRFFSLAAYLLPLLAAPGTQAQQSAAPPLPDIRQLMIQVHEHQKQLDKVRENYTYSSLATVQELDSTGQVKKTESEEYEAFFVNSHPIERTVKKNGKPLDSGEEQKETERVTKLVEKAQVTPPGQALEGQAVSVSRLLDIMDVRNERRVSFRGRMAIVFDFVGRKDAQTHGQAEEASKDLQGTIWIDEADRQVARVEAAFDDNFHIGGGLIANVQKGSHFSFDQAPVNGEIWLPTGGDATMQARVMLLKTVRRHITQRDYDYKRFRVETEPGKDANVVTEKK
ncbi:MAG: hypothetical protein ABR906_10215 [Terracidiphilus sp.]